MVDPADVRRRLRVAGCVFADDEALVLLDAAGDDGERLEALVRRREAGEPLEHIVGWAEFRGRRVVVHPGVFVPRNRSALVVDLALRHLREGAVVVDVCCGSGALAAAIVAEAPDVTAFAVDCDPLAVACARANLAPEHVLVGDLFEPLPSSLVGRVDLVVASAPYVPSSEVDGLPREARRHEPLAALDGGADGLDIYRRIVTAIPTWSATDCALVIEVANHQADTALALVEAAGLDASVEIDDERDATAIVGVAQPRPRRRAVGG